MKEGDIEKHRQPEIDPATELTLADRALFDEVVACVDSIKKKDLDGKDGEYRYWKMRDIVRDSLSHDVGYEIDRWLGVYLRPGLVMTPETEKLRELVEKIRIRGFRSMARMYLEAATGDGLKTGGTVEEKIAGAEKYAKLAGVPLAQIAQEAGLEITEE